MEIDILNEKGNGLLGRNVSIVLNLAKKELNKGNDRNFYDILVAMVEEIKPAHLAVEYIFTYKLWQDIMGAFENWEGTKVYSWEYLLVFEIQNTLNIADDGKVYYCPENKGNAYVVRDGTKAYARRNE